MSWIKISSSVYILTDTGELAMPSTQFLGSRRDVFRTLANIVPDVGPVSVRMD